MHPILMAQFSIPRLPQQTTMAEEPRLDIYPTNSYNQWRTDPLPAAINFNPFAPSSSSTTVASAVDPLTFDSGCFSDADSESDRDVSSLVSDLFDEFYSSESFRAFVGDGSGLCSASNPSSEPANECGIWGFADEDFNAINYVEDLGFTIGVEPGISISESDLDVQDVDSRISGLRILGVDSESESDAEEQINAIFELNSDRENDINWVESPNNLWNGFGLQEQRNVYEDFEWEEVADRVGQRETPNVVADGLEELSEASGMSSEQERRLEAARTLDRGILIRINDYPIDATIQHGIDREYFLAVEDNFTNTFDYDALFGQILDNENALRGSPPAARSAVENLPLVELKMEGLKDEHVVCAVCKDDMPLEGKAKKLPCCHYYHEDCILPWLNIRNTCPACRYELPTDDPDYERRKTQRARDRVELDLQVQNVPGLISLR